MFVRVYPVLRLPRRFGVFDYRVPEGMQVCVGDLVAIPFHGRSAFGVVAQVRETTDLLGVVHAITDVTWRHAASADDIDRIVALGQAIAQSPATLFAHMYGTLHIDHASPAPLTPSTHRAVVPRTVADVVQRAMAYVTPDARVCVQTSPEGGIALAQLLRKKLPHQLLVLTPRARDADLALRAVAFPAHTAVLHGTTKPRERERILRAWRSGALTTLIGTGQAALLPASRLSAVVVLTSGTDDHFSNRRNPRFDTRLAGYAQAQQHHAAFVTTDVLPRPEEYAAMQNVCFSEDETAVHVVDLKDPRDRGDVPLLSIPLQNAIKTALQSQKNVLLFYNRKGTAARAQCRACQAVLQCSCGSVYAVDDEGLHCVRCSTRQALPEACTHCKTGIIGLRGIGNAHIATALQTLFPAASIGRIEKGHVDPARITLATEYYFSSVVTPFAPKTFGLVADLAADLALHPDDFRSGERAARNLARLRAFAQAQGAACVVQTWLPDEIGGMLHKERFLATETKIRETYGLPPARAVLTVRHADAAALAALTGQFFATASDDTVTARVTPADLPTVLTACATLPDTAVLSIDMSYDSTNRTPRTQS